MLRILLLILLFPIAQGIAQTDIIALRSHSGNLTKFTKTSSRAMNKVETNFGMLREPEVTNAALDTVRYLSNGSAVMVTSEYCGSIHLSTPILDEYGCVVREANLGRFWKAGADTVYNHPLFKRNHSLDSIKEILRTTYNFQNSMDSVVFIGYDNALMDLKKAEQEHEKKIQQGRETRNPTKGGFGLGLLFSILGPIFIIYVLSPFLFASFKRDFRHSEN